MLKKEITFTDFNGNEVTDTFYFNLTKTELLQMEATEEMSTAVKGIIASSQAKDVLGFFRRIIIASYGEKSLDGKHFLKSDDISNMFVQSAAFDALFMEMLETPEKLGAFVEGMMPKDLIVAAKEEMKELGKLTSVPNEES